MAMAAEGVLNTCTLQTSNLSNTVHAGLCSPQDHLADWEPWLTAAPAAQHHVLLALKEPIPNSNYG
jgi:hypothetical protein